MPDRNGDLRADAFTVEAVLPIVIPTIKCPDVYGTDFIIWEALALSGIFTGGTSVEPDGTLVYETVNGNSYYDTFTQEIVVADGTDITITNTSEETITIYVVSMSTLFTALPTKAQLDDMYKLFMMNGTTTELLTIDDIFYVDYTNNVIHNLTTIYGTGNEPLTVEAFETLKAKYTNTVVKAPEFTNDLQNELVMVSKADNINTPKQYVVNDIDTAIDSLNGLTLREVFEDGNLFNNDLVTADNATLVSYVDNVLVYNNTNQISIVQTTSKVSVVTGQKIFISYNLKSDTAAAYSNIYTRDTISSAYTPNNTLVVDEENVYTQIKDITVTTDSRIAVRLVLFDDTYTSSTNELKDIYFVNLNTLGLQALTAEQMDEYFEMYNYLKGATTFTDLEALQLVANGDFDEGTTGWDIHAEINYDTLYNDLHIDITSGTLTGTRYITSNLGTRTSIYIYYDFDNISMPVDYGTFAIRTTGYTNLYPLSNITGNHSYLLNLASNNMMFAIGHNFNRDIEYRLDNVYIFDKVAMQMAQVYSPLYEDTFDNLLDSEIKAQMDVWVKLLTILNGSTTKTGTDLLANRYYVDYDNLKIYDYAKAEPYLTTTPEDIEVFMADVLDHTEVVNFPTKAIVRKAKFTILGDYIVAGVDD